MKKDERPVVAHILTILAQNKGVGLREAEVIRQARKQGWNHMQYSIEYNLKYLVDRGKIVKVDKYFGIPLVREDGTAYFKFSNSTAIIELGKLCKNEVS